MNDNEKEFIKNVNIDKAKNKIKACIALTIVSLISYVIPLMVVLILDLFLKFLL